MTPIESAMLFATITSLLADFNSSRRSDKAATVEEFASWLASQRHEQLLRLVTQNQSTLVGLKALLSEGRQKLASRLDSLDQKMALIGSQTDGFQELALAVRPHARLSEQALSVLEQLVAAGATSFTRSGTLAGPGLRALNGNGPTCLTISESGFIVSDVETLVELGFVRFVDTNGHFEPVYALDRSAVSLLKGLGRA